MKVLAGAASNPVLVAALLAPNASSDGVEPSILPTALTVELSNDAIDRVSIHAAASGRSMTYVCSKSQA